MKISSEYAALALAQTSKAPKAVASKQQEADAAALKEKVNGLPRTIVDTVELSEAKPAAQISRSEAQNTQQPAPPASTPPSDPLDALLKSFGARAGEDGYNQALDANGDGIINFSDLNASLNNSGEPVTGGPQPVEPDPSAANPGSILTGDADALPPTETPPSAPVTGGPLPVEPDPSAANPGSLAADDADAVEPGATEQPGATPGEEPTDDGPAVFTADDVDQALAAFGSSEGDDAFNASYDFDGDGTINFGDLNELLSRFGDQQQSQQTLLDQLTERFGASSGDQGFNANLDFDGDGIINFGDLNQLLANLAQTPSGGE